MIENIDELKAHINIVEIISNYLPLQKKGGNYTACCPFHNEATASFMVSPAKQIYHCFGCGAGGDSIHFVRELQKIGYVEAIKEISDIIGFNLIFKESKADGITQTNELFLEHCLKGQEFIMEIALKRGISEEVVKEFCIGYSGQNFQIRNLYENKEIALKIGILSQGNNGYTSMFERRLIIPIFNAGGKCVGFAGRSLESKQNPKYINSRQTKLYNKSKILFGYDKARKHIAKAKSVYIVEGYFDVMALHTQGFKNSVALCGTAFTKEHVGLLSRYDDLEINLALDNDEAGKSATLKAISLLLEYELYNSFVLSVDTKEKDFNDMLLRDKEIFSQLEKGQERVKKIPIIEYALNDIYKRVQQGKSIETKSRIIKEVGGLLNSVKDGYIRVEYNKFANKLFGFNIANIKSINQSARKNPRQTLMYNITLARVLKEAYNNREYKDILKNNANRECFTPLEECYDCCMSDTLNHTLAHIVFNDEYILRYGSLNDFVSDLNSIVKHAQNREKMRFLQSGASLKDKIAYSLEN